MTRNQGLEAQGVPRDTLPYKVRQPLVIRDLSFSNESVTGTISAIRCLVWYHMYSYHCNFQGFRRVRWPDVPHRRLRHVRLSFYKIAPNENNNPDLFRFLPPSFSAYIGIPVFGILVAFWKWQYGDRTVPYQKMDLISGKEEIDQEEEMFLAAQRLLGPQPKWRRIWNSL